MAYAGRLDGEPVEVEVGADALVAGERSIAYVDMDEAAVDGHTTVLTVAGGGNVVLSHFGAANDDFLLKFGAARRAARRAALLQWTGDAPIDEYLAGPADVGTAKTVVLFRDGLTVESWGSAPELAPFSLVERVDRDGYVITIGRRAGLEPITLRQMGQRTDEFLLDLEAARADLAQRTRDAYAALSPSLADLAAPDGWAVGATAAGDHWPALRSVVAGERAEEVDLLESLAGDRLRLGVKAQTGTDSMPFVLAPVGGKVAVEGTAADTARATFVFATDDVDRLNAVLLLTSFRREAISSPEEELGRWAVAVRTLEIVRWARAALVARVVHDEQWSAKVAAALSP